MIPLTWNFYISDEFVHALYFDPSSKQMCLLLTFGKFKTGKSFVNSFNFKSVFNNVNTYHFRL